MNDMTEHAQTIILAVDYHVRVWLGSSMAVGSFAWGFIGTNQPQITVIFGFAGFCCMLHGVYRMYRPIRLKDRRKTK